MSVWKRTKDAVVRFFKAPTVLNAVDSSRGWITLMGDTTTGSWQQDAEIDFDTVMANWTIFACTTLISSDVAKCSLRLMERKEGIWVETESPAFSPVLRKPNGYQNTQQFLECWMHSKLTHGNTYVLKERDSRGVVVRLHVLEPSRVKVLYSNSGDVFYQLNRDELSEVPEDVPAVPASEVIHDRFNTIFHRLQGLSPLFASGVAAAQGSAIQKNSSKFFENMSRPSGILSAPGAISDTTAARLKASWEENYSGTKIGRVAILGDGLDYKPMSVTAVDSQLVEQSKMSAEVICSTFHIPPYKVGIGALPSGNKVGEMNTIYYEGCLHTLMDAVQNCLTEGLGLLDPIGGRRLKVMFDLDDLLKMDAATMMATIKVGIDAGVLAPNEGRKRVNLPPVAGGDTPYLQHQDYALAALAKRDAKEDPFETGGNTVDSGTEGQENDETEEEGPQERTYRILNGLGKRKSLAAEFLH